MGSQRRSQLEIMCDILEACREGVNKTKIVYNANLNFTRLNKYLSTLLSLGFVELSVAYEGKNTPALNVVYETSEAGENFLSDCLTMQKNLRRFSIKKTVRVKPLR